MNILIVLGIFIMYAAASVTDDTPLYVMATMGVIGAILVLIGVKIKRIGSVKDLENLK